MDSMSIIYYNRMSRFGRQSEVDTEILNCEEKKGILFQNGYLPSLFQGSMVYSSLVEYSVFTWVISYVDTLYHNNNTG